MSAEEHSPASGPDGMAARLFQARQAASLRQDDVQQRLGLGANTVSLWERGEMQPRADKLAALCRLYGVSADWILGLSQTPKIGGRGGIINLAEAVRELQRIAAGDDLAALEARNALARLRKELAQ